MRGSPVRRELARAFGVLLALGPVAAAQAGPPTPGAEALLGGDVEGTIEAYPGDPAALTRETRKLLDEAGSRSSEATRLALLRTYLAAYVHVLPDGREEFLASWRANREGWRRLAFDYANLAQTPGRSSDPEGCSSFGHPNARSLYVLGRMRADHEDGERCAMLVYVRAWRGEDSPPPQPFDLSAPPVPEPPTPWKHHRPDLPALVLAMVPTFPSSPFTAAAALEVALGVEQGAWKLLRAVAESGLDDEYAIPFLLHALRWEASEHAPVEVAKRVEALLERKPRRLDADRLLLLAAERWLEGWGAAQLEAFPLCERLLRERPHSSLSPRVRVARFRALSKGGKPDAAVAAIDELLSDPQTLALMDEPLHELALEMHRLSPRRDPRQVLEEHLRRFPGSPRAFAVRSMLARLNGSISMTEGYRRRITLAFEDAVEPLPRASEREEARWVIDAIAWDIREGLTAPPGGPSICGWDSGPQTVATMRAGVLRDALFDLAAEFHRQGREEEAVRLLTRFDRATREAFQGLGEKLSGTYCPGPPLSPEEEGASCPFVRDALAHLRVLDFEAAGEARALARVLAERWPVGVKYFPLAQKMGSGWPRTPDDAFARHVGWNARSALLRLGSAAASALIDKHEELGRPLPDVGIGIMELLAASGDPTAEAYLEDLAREHEGTPAANWIRAVLERERRARGR